MEECIALFSIEADHDRYAVVAKKRPTTIKFRWINNKREWVHVHHSTWTYPNPTMQCYAFCDN